MKITYHNRSVRGSRAHVLNAVGRRKTACSRLAQARAGSQKILWKRPLTGIEKPTFASTTEQSTAPQQYTAAKAIAEFCGILEKQVCNDSECEHLGGICEAPGCDNHVCALHQAYCSRCEQLYCKECYSAHLPECGGPPSDQYESFA